MSKCIYCLCTMKKKKIIKDRYNFLISKEVHSDFSLICEELGLIKSKQVKRIISWDMNIL